MPDNSDDESSHISSDKENASPTQSKLSHTSRYMDSKKLRELDPVQAKHARKLELEGDTSVYDPEQPAEERRKVRKDYRDLQRQVDEGKSDFLRPENNGLLEIFKKSNELYKNVKQTSDATLDSRLLVTASDLTLKKVQSMVVGTAGVGIDVDEFVHKCREFMKSAGQPEAQVDEDDDEDHGDEANWGFLGAAVWKGNKRAATSDFLLGPLSVQKKIRVQKAKRMGLGKKGKTSNPTTVDAGEMKQSENSTMALVKTMFKIIFDYMEARDEENQRELYFNFVMNPESFSQTVENIFFLSFLAKEGKVAIYDDENNGLPYLELSEPADQAKKDAGKAPLRQMIFSITMYDWKRTIETFGIKKSIIPTRQKEVLTLGATGWYT